MLARTDPTPRCVTGAEPPADGARRLAAFTDYDGLIRALNEQVDELRISRQDLDHVAGLPTGLAGKLLGPSRIKNLGLTSLWLLLGAIGCRLVLEEDAEARARMAGRWRPRREMHRRVGVVRKRMSAELISAVAAEMGRRGAQARRQRREGRRS